MGGYGSTRWGHHSKKTTVEDCHTFAVTDFGFTPYTEHAGALTWGPAAWISYRWHTHARGGWLRLMYTITATGERIDYTALLEATPCNFGGERWWLRCPGRGCGRRCAKLHLPPGARYFACRECYDLTYKSTQTWDARAARWRGRRGDLMSAMLRGDVDLLKGMTMLRSLG